MACLVILTSSALFCSLLPILLLFTKIAKMAVFSPNFRIFYLEEVSKCRKNEKKLHHQSQGRLTVKFFVSKKKTCFFVAFGLEFGFDSLKIALKTRFARYESDF